MVRVIVRAMGTNPEMRTWPDGWPVPRAGEEIELGNAPMTLTVLAVVWHPEGDVNADDPTPYVYVVARA